MPYSTSLFVLGLFFALPALADSSFTAQKYDRALGKPIGAAFSASTTTSQAQSEAQLEVLGKSMTAMQSQVNVTDDPDGTSYMDVYSFGLRVFSQSGYFSNNGLLGFNAGLLPTEIRVPLVLYPIGPLTLEIDGGVRFQATATAQLSPTIVIGSADLSSVSLQMQADAIATGFVQGYAEALFIRAGLGSDLNLIDASANLQAQFRFDGTAPTANVTAMARFLNGSIYGFADLFDIFEMGWGAPLD